MKNKFFLGFIISFVYFIVHLAIINDYGISWDYHFHYYGGLHHLGLSVPSINDPSPVPFTPPDPRLTIYDPFGPIMAIVPTLSQIVFFDKLHLFPFDSAFNLPSIVYGAIGVGILFVFLYEVVGVFAASIASFYLALLPNYFGYVHTNMKDIPVAVLFALSLYFFWKLVSKRRYINLILACLSFGIAFNVKINAITIPIVNLSWYVLTHFKKLFQRKGRVVLLYVFLAPLIAFLVWFPFWDDPLGKLLEIVRTFSVNTYNMPVLFFGNTYRSGINIPFYYPYLYIAITTPLPILLSFIVGLIVCIKSIFAKITNNDSQNWQFYLLLLLWFFVPLLRFLLPNVSTIDGIRHFMEVVFPLCAIAGIGSIVLYKLMIKTIRVQIILFIIISLSFLSLIYNVIFYHPYQTSYFNFLVGGIKGANGQFDVDFWGTPQKEAMIWLNKNASLNSYVYVVMAQSSAGMYAREDIRKNLNKKSILESNYVVILNRQSFIPYDIELYKRKQIGEKRMVFVKEIDDVPLVWVFENK